MKLRSLVLVLAASLPFAVSAATLNANLEPAAIDRAAAEQIALDVLASEAPPKACREIAPSSDAATGEAATGCCWVFIYGLWRCFQC